MAAVTERRRRGSGGGGRAALRLIREAMARDGLDAVIVCGTEYTGFDGGVIYLSGFAIVHRYAYVLLRSRATRRSSSRARLPTSASTGRRGSTSRCSSTAGRVARGPRARKRVGVFGLDYVMPVRDFQALDAQRRSSRGTSASTTLERSRVTSSSRRSATASGSTRRASGSSSRRSRRADRAGDPCALRGVLRRAGLRPQDDGHGADGENGAALPEFKIAGPRRSGRPTWCCRRSRSAGPGGHWVEISRAICPGEPSDETKRMLEAYQEYYDARAACCATARPRTTSTARFRRASSSAASAWPRHRTLDRDDDDRVPEDRRGRRDGAARRHGVLDAPPRDLADGRACLYMQDTWLVTADSGLPLAALPLRIFDGTEIRP